MEMDFIWPESTGYLLFSFDRWDEEEKKSSRIGVLFKYGTDQGMYVGDVYPILYPGKSKSKNYVKRSLGAMGTTKSFCPAW